MDRRSLLPPPQEFSLNIVKREPIEEDFEIREFSFPRTNLKADAKRPKPYDKTVALSPLRPRKRLLSLKKYVRGNHHPNNQNQIDLFTQSFGQCQPQPQVQSFLASPVTRLDSTNQTLTESQTHEPIDKQPEIEKSTKLKPSLRQSEIEEAFHFWRPWICAELKHLKKTSHLQTEPEFQQPELDKPTEPQVPKPIKRETENENPIQPQPSARESVIKANLNLNLKRKAIETEGLRVKVTTKVDPNNMVYCTIPGRLSLLGKAKYDVTVGELVRRVSQPECLNKSLISGLVRTAKKKDGGDELKEKLNKVGIKLAPNRAKQCKQTSFTGLVEGEAIQIASDFGTIVKNEFPTNEFAQMLAESDDSDQMIKDTEKFLKNFSSFLKNEKNVHNLEMLTHNFSVPAMMATVELMQDVIKEGLSGEHF